MALGLSPDRSLCIRELVDMVISVKETGKVTDLEDVGEESVQVNIYYRFNIILISTSSVVYIVA